MTAEQFDRLPEMLRDIVVTDRKLDAARAAVRAAAVPMIADIRRLAGLRADQVRRARHLYGRAPLRGENGPGRPTSARA
ncbi:hypothetical protein FV232_00915 [Methylobacterium sp. WL30]|uniref:hypothetical protein n=1 Tax=unclassified Methylobacterium TaxID=2615210 RepID=UPI0011CBED4D|nr:MULTISPECIES: hypothetical protein [unclassified Methylobacterium]TXN38984.1 hypothetical protein FV225_11685 [Methylobacterium sp. WL93]TXN52271.1 hypothetical protein FV227_04255 [Methylobacterium sp. WL119]TXN70646.1 hypothetical protein FV232_00915 [Methylobacterium sp. WL30]